MAKILVLAAAVPLLFGPSARADDHKPQSEPEPVSTECTQPVPERRYTDDTLIYLLSVDLTDCDWWDGSPIQLDVTLARLDAEGEEVANVVTLCGVGAAPEEADLYRTTSCESTVDLEHPGVEVARYRGEVTFPWQDGERTVGFTVLCAAPALQCQEP
jgi:hypothetical protein